MLSPAYFSTNHASTYVQGRPSPPSKLIQTILDYLRTSFPPHFNNCWPLAVDVGAGSGQSTFLLKDYFVRVLGVDISEAQIEEARIKNQYQNINFEVAPAESIPVEDNSVSLLIGSQCVHWFNLTSFYSELKRIMAPGGVFAAFGYCAAPIKTTNDPIMNGLAEIVESAYNELIGNGFGNREVLKVHEAKYATLPTPFQDSLKIDNIQYQVTYTGENFILYIKSWSMYHEFTKANPDKVESFNEKITNQMKKVLSTEDFLSASCPVTFEFFLVMSRK